MTILLTAIGDSKANPDFWVNQLPRSMFRANTISHPASHLTDWTEGTTYFNDVANHPGDVLSINLGHVERIGAEFDAAAMDFGMLGILESLRNVYDFRLIVLWAIQPWMWQSLVYVFPNTIAIPEWRVLGTCDYKDKDPNPPPLDYGLHPNLVGSAKMAAHFSAAVMEAIT